MLMRYRLLSDYMESWIWRLMLNANSICNKLTKKLETHLQEGYAWMETARRARTTTAMRTECASFWCIFLLLLLLLLLLLWCVCVSLDAATLLLFSGCSSLRKSPIPKVLAGVYWTTNGNDRKTFTVPWKLLWQEDQVLRSTVETLTLRPELVWLCVGRVIRTEIQ